MSGVENPPAFPTETATGYLLGMTLRDYFAGQALAGAMAATAYEGVEWSGIARECYAIADAMLAARCAS